MIEGDYKWDCINKNERVDRPTSSMSDYHLSICLSITASEEQSSDAMGH
jgi:hypothetical protein